MGISNVLHICSLLETESTELASYDNHEETSTMHARNLNANARNKISSAWSHLSMLLVW